MKPWAGVGLLLGALLWGRSNVVAQNTDAGNDRSGARDTVQAKDTTRVKDSVSKKDTTLVVKDSVSRKDSISIGDSVTSKDTLPVRDSLALKDSLKVRDTLNLKDSVAKTDSLQIKEVIKWDEQDSVIERLLTKSGYKATRYQGAQVEFRANERIIKIVGSPAGVGRDKTLIVGDTVIFNDSTNVVVAYGDTVVLRDPDQQGADVVAVGRVTYNIAERRGAVTNVSTSIESGERYFVSGKVAAFHNDTTAKRTVFFIGKGDITSCDETEPHYHIRGRELKYVSKNIIAVRPATLYIADVPVFWLPFFFQDIRPGRRSGLLRPRLGFSEFVRNSPTYRRHIENIGYYANLGHYFDAQVAMDWRSGARSVEGDPGFMRYNAEVRYNWLDRFVNGGIAASRENRGDGSTNTSVSWNHTQQFSQTSRFVSNINFVTNTTVQRETVFDPRRVLATIRSDARYNRKIGPFSLDVGGNRTQYPGRTQIDESYPNISISSPTLGVSDWFEWTPAFNFDRRAVRKSDAVQSISYRYFTNPAGLPDSSRLEGGTENTSFRFNTPFNIKGFRVSANISAQSQESNFPVYRTFIDTTDTTQRYTRTYSKSYLDAVDWSFNFALPSFLNNSLKVSPSISFDNVMSGSYWVRSELSGGKFVSQGKRVSGGVSISPTVFGLWPGFGPFSRIRHSISPSFSYRYAPRGRVNQEYLQALNQTGGDFLGNLAQQQVTMNLSQVFEAKFKTDTGDGKKVKLLAVNFSSFTYDFEKARKSRSGGFATDRFSYDLSSDLLPGLSFRSSYSLFQGSILSDTARFKPYREEISASFKLDSDNGLGAKISRFLNRSARGEPENAEEPKDTTVFETPASLPVAGTLARDRQYSVPQVNGWASSISFSTRRQRPPTGGRVLTYDPATYCLPFSANPIIYDQCQQSVLLNPQTSLPYVDPIAGGVFVRMPTTATIQAQNNFRITRNWSASWNTMYDVVNKSFASHQVNLERELHDWKATFSFTSSPNGNFYFSFVITNKAQPQLTLPYQQSTYRQQDIR